MTRHLNLKSICFFFPIFLILSSCNSDDTTTTSTNTPSTTNTPSSTDVSPATAVAEKPAALAGTLDVLYIERKAFDDINRGSKLVYCHTFATDEKVHLDGWLLDGNRFPNASPTMKLKNGSSSGINYGPGFYFGNVVLHANGFNKIKDALNANPKLNFVIFSPKIVNSYHIGYDIYVQETSGFTNSGGLLAVTDVNPSPPKNY